MADPISEPLPVGDTAQEDLQRQLQELRRTVESLRRGARSRPKVTLRALQSRPYLGQPVQVVATVASAAGEPIADCPLTLTTTWGQLRARGDAWGQEGSGLDTRTGEDSSVLVTLLSPTVQNLPLSQRDALEVALKGLDPAARTPAEATDGLRELVRQYRLDGSAELRRAIDLHFQDFGKRLRENPRAYGDAWSYADATVFAFARDGSEEDEDAFDTAVLAMAALPLRFTNWLGPWLKIFLDLSESESTLKAELQAGQKPEAEPDELLGRVYGQVRDFVSDQKGTVGELVARKVAEGTLRDFLDTGLKDLPAATQAALFPALEVASSTLATAGPSVLAAVGQTRTDLNRRIAGVPAVDLTGVTGRIDQLAGQINAKADATAVEGLRTEFSGSLASKADRTTLDNLSTNFNREIGTLKETTVKLNDRVTADRTVLDNLSTNFTREIGTLKETTVKLNDRVTADRTVLDNLSTNFNREIGALKETTVKLNDRVTADRTVLDNLSTNFNREIGTLKETTVKLNDRVTADRTVLDNLSTNFNREIGTLKETTVKLNEGLGRIDTSVARIDTTLRDTPIFRRPSG